MDYKLFKSINQLVGRYPFLDTIMIAISQKMRYLFILIFIVMWFRNHLHRKITILAIFSGGITLLLEFIIKQFYFKPRPFVNHHAQVLPPSPSQESPSFPSKHTTLAFATATAVIIHKWVLGSIMYILAILTGFSRIWMGQHYPSDIVGSAMLGTITSIIANAFIKKQ
ncbi:MAG: phosphatase PAP2 family protein [Bacillaceae bacterium]